MVIGGEVVFVFLIIFFTLFSLLSFKEKEKRAFILSTLVLILLILTNLVFSLARPPLKNWLFACLFIFGLIMSSYRLLSGRLKGSQRIVGEQRKIDERDVILARFDLKEGSDIYNSYYSRMPEYKDVDNDIRKLPDILTAPHQRKNPELFSLASAEFHFLERLLTLVDGKESPERLELSAPEHTRIVKDVLKYSGADLSGICALNQTCVYSHVGRGPETYGEEIQLSHSFAILFALEMDIAMIAQAPHAPVIVETGRKYVEAARISIVIADFIRRLGYSARAHIAGSNCQTMLPPLGWEAGLGELGRLGVLITKTYGPRARLGLVTTDLPLVVDKPVTAGIQDFCQKCKKCARNCPAQAIPYGDRVEENGSLRWVIKREACYKFWRKAGTDCAVCLSVCPYSKADNLFHSFIRRFNGHSSLFQRVSIFGDDFFYGRFPPRGLKNWV